MNKGSYIFNANVITTQKMLDEYGGKIKFSDYIGLYVGNTSLSDAEMSRKILIDDAISQSMIFEILVLNTRVERILKVMSKNIKAHTKIKEKL